MKKKNIYTRHMEEREKIIAHIRNQYKDRFRIFDNTGKDKKVVAGLFPDMIFMRPEPPPNNDVLFVFKIETSDSDLVSNVPEWKTLASTPSSFYLVVPKSKIDEAKKLTSITAIPARFASYEMEKGEVKQMHYE